MNWEPATFQSCLGLWRGGTGSSRASSIQAGCAGLTLIELVVVLALLGLVLGVSAPALSKFFRGRELDNEVNRFIALARYAQQRAVSDGVPMLMWVDFETLSCGVSAEATFVAQDSQRVEYTMASGISIDVEVAEAPVRAGVVRAVSGSGQVGSGRLSIRFMPDGFATVESPTRVVFRDRDGFTKVVVLNEARTGYKVEVGAGRRY